MHTRTRLDTAVVTTCCFDDAEHQVRFTLDGVSTSMHDPDADAVAAALGAAPHACQQAVNAFTAARVMLTAVTGERDIPELSFRRGRWSHSHTCPRCTSHPSLHHLTSARHLASAYDGDEHTTKVLFRWLLRRENPSGIAPLSPAQARESARTYEGWSEPEWDGAWGLREYLLSDAFMRAGEKVVGARVQQVVALRRGGLQVQWLRYVAENCTPAALQHAQETNRSWARTLTRARNVPASVMVGFINAGITAHFYTYHHYRVTPAQVLQVWNASGGRCTLAQLLNDGVSVPEALAQYR